IISFNSDPIAGIQANVGTIGIRTDIPLLYIKNSSTAGDWVTIGTITGPVSNSMLAKAPSCTVKANPTSTTNSEQDFPASADGQVLGRSQGALAFATPDWGLFGNGSDGSPTFDGINPQCGITPVGMVYELTGAPGRDLYLDSPTINAGVTIK